MLLFVQDARRGGLGASAVLQHAGGHVLRQAGGLGLGAAGGKVRLHHLAVGRPELHASHRHSRRPPQPAFKGVQEGGLLRRGTHHPAVVRREVGIKLLGGLRPGGRLEPQQQLELAELHGLEARGRGEDVPEVPEVEGRHGLQHPELVEQDPLDLHHPIQAAAHLEHGALQHMRFQHEVAHGAQLEQDLLEPQLIHLVHDDEEHLVVRRPAVEGALPLLAGEECIHLQIAPIVHALIPATLPGHPGHRALQQRIRAHRWPQRRPMRGRQAKGRGFGYLPPERHALCTQGSAFPLQLVQLGADCGSIHTRGPPPVADLREL
mmetsp:Transcript_39915/g.127656  ORF Transcript_39915/g.127656 Transcript_39915/m.127656 type:complete len:320 (+) Transcript_39915:487-1446(+)